MPSKKKRVASRQAQLSQRKRRERIRGRRADTDTDPGTGFTLRPRQAEAGVPAGTADAVGEAPEREAPEAQVVQPAMPTTRRRRRGAAARLEPVPTYPHLRAEVQHIGIVTGVIVALLVVLTVVLR